MDAVIGKCQNLTMILAFPNLSSRAEAMDQVGIKATTTEWLGFEGREEGIVAQDQYDYQAMIQQRDIERWFESFYSLQM